VLSGARSRHSQNKHLAVGLQQDVDVASCSGRLTIGRGPAPVWYRPARSFPAGRLRRTRRPPAVGRPVGRSSNASLAASSIRCRRRPVVGARRAEIGSRLAARAAGASRYLIRKQDTPGPTDGRTDGPTDRRGRLIRQRRRRTGRRRSQVAGPL